jgi:hypothetical protein
VIKGVRSSVTAFRELQFCADTVEKAVKYPVRWEARSFGEGLEGFFTRLLGRDAGRYEASISGSKFSEPVVSAFGR